MSMHWSRYGVSNGLEREYKSRGCKAEHWSSAWAQGYLIEEKIQLACGLKRHAREGETIGWPLPAALRMLAHLHCAREFGKASQAKFDLIGP